MDTWPEDDRLSVLRSDETCYIYLTGDVDAYRVERLPQPEALTAHGDVDRVSLDLTDVQHIDSSGLRWVLRIHRFARARGRMMSVTVRNGSLTHRTIQLIGAGSVFEVEVI